MQHMIQKRNARFSNTLPRAIQVNRHLNIGFASGAADGCTAIGQQGEGMINQSIRSLHRRLE